MASKIFISYRRDDSAGTAGRLYDRLVEKFGEANLFIDVDNMPAGADFVGYLANQVAICDIFLCAVGPNWLGAKDDEGRRRLDQADDFVKIEIAEALKRNIPVIPVLIDGARVPRARELPDEIAALTRRHAVEVRNSYFRRDTDGLIREIQKHVRSASSRAVFAALGLAITILIFGAISLSQIKSPPPKLSAVSEYQNNAVLPPTEQTMPLTTNPSQKITELEQVKRNAELGSDAMTNLGLRYALGEGVPQDYAEAKRWWEKAAGAGVASAMGLLGALYEMGWGVQQDYGEAKRWYEKASAAGDSNAMTLLGNIYYSGHGVPQDYAEAKRWYEIAAAAGNSNAMIGLGDLYRDGRGVTKSVADARAWYQKAAAAGSPQAQSRLSALPSK
jgi:TPR repeat protein